MDDSAVSILHNCTHDPNAHHGEPNTTRYYYSVPATGDGADSPCRTDDV